MKRSFNSVLVIEDRLADLVDRPHARRIVGIVDEAAGEDFVAVAGRVKEIDCLTAACDAVAGRTDVERDIVPRDDVGRLSHFVPGFQRKRDVMKFARFGAADESDVMRLVMGLGVATGISDTLEASLAWVIRVLRPIPGLAWVPFAILWFGIDATAAIFIIGIGVFWISYFAAHGAVRAVDRDLIEVAEAFGFRRADQKLIKVILPSAAPGILAGLRTALGQAWMAVVASEIFGVPGLGQRMMQAANLLASDVVVVYMATMAALYGMFDSGFVALQSWLLRWKR